MVQLIEITVDKDVKANLWRDATNVELSINDNIELWDSKVTYSSYWKEHVLHCNQETDIKIRYLQILCLISYKSLNKSHCVDTLVNTVEMEMLVLT